MDKLFFARIAFLSRWGDDHWGKVMTWDTNRRRQDKLRTAFGQGCCRSRRDCSKLESAELDNDVKSDRVRAQRGLYQKPENHVFLEGLDSCHWPARGEVLSGALETGGGGARSTATKNGSRSAQMHHDACSAWDGAAMYDKLACLAGVAYRWLQNPACWQKSLLDLIESTNWTCWNRNQLTMRKIFSRTWGRASVLGPIVAAFVHPR